MPLWVESNLRKYNNEPQSRQVVLQQKTAVV
jgi:hypothetical protein